jgi:hypothetical protein
VDCSGKRYFDLNQSVPWRRRCRGWPLRFGLIVVVACAIAGTIALLAS